MLAHKQIRREHIEKKHGMQSVFLAEIVCNLLPFANSFAPFSRFFSFSFDTRLFVMLSATSFSQYTVLLNLAIETF